MGDNLDDFAQNLQEQIYVETRETYGDVFYDRWLNPLFMGSIKNPDGYTNLTGVCGDTIEIFLKFQKDRITEISFRTDGCGSSIVCGSFAAELSVGKYPDEILEITGEKILEILGGLPKEDEHCAFLAAEALHEASSNYMIRQTKKNRI